MPTWEEEKVVCLIPHSFPLVSVIIPSLDGYREGNVPRLVQAIRDLSFKNLELLIVKGIRPNGRARDEGVKAARGKYYVFMDDDVAIGTSNLMDALIAPFSNPAERIGMTGASYRLPPEASDFQKKVARQIPRVECPTVDKITESDMVCHACLAVPASVYREVGGEDRELISGTDPDFKARIREQGYKVVLAPNTFVYMPTYKNFNELCRKAFTTGCASALTQRVYPGLVFDSSTQLEGKVSSPANLGLRILRSCLQFFLAALKGHTLFIASRTCYAFGYLAGRLRPAVSSKSDSA